MKSNSNFISLEFNLRNGEKIENIVENSNVTLHCDATLKQASGKLPPVHNRININIKSDSNFIPGISLKVVFM